MNNPQRPQEPHAGWTGECNYSELVDHLQDCRLYMDHLETRLTEAERLLGESQGCLKAAKRLWASTTTNSVADDVIAANEAFLNQEEDKDE